MTRIDSNKLARIFISTAGAVLLASALVVFISCGSSDRSILPRDPLFLLPLPIFCWILGGMEFAVAAYCLFGKSTALRTGLVLWFALNFLIYRAGMYYSGVTGGLNGYTGIISDAFGISRSVADVLMGTTVLYLFFGAALFLAWSWWIERQERLHPTVILFCWSCRQQIRSSQENIGLKIPCPHCQRENTVGDPVAATPSPVLGGRSQAIFIRTLKISCTACGGHIEFPTNFFGEKTPCPHCHTTITLQKPRNLKMSCTGCEGHIEFPDYAIGQTIPCPHCQEAITLKEPA